MPVFLQQPAAPSKKQKKSHRMRSAVFQKTDLKFPPESCHWYRAEYTLARWSVCCPTADVGVFHTKLWRIELMDENCLCLLLWGTVTKEDLLTHSGRNNKQIERVNKWTSASASPLLPWHCAGRRSHNIIFSTLTISFRDFQRLSTGFLLSSRFINAWECNFSKSISRLWEEKAKSKEKHAGAVEEERKDRGVEEKGRLSLQARVLTDTLFIHSVYCYSVARQKRVGHFKPSVLP